MKQSSTEGKTGFKASTNRLVWKLLRKHISPLQLAGFFFANLLGMFIVLLGLQFYKDIEPLFTGKEGLFKNEFIVLTKRVSTFSSLSSTAGAFQPKEIEDISAQSFAHAVGAFTPSTYHVRTAMSIGSEEERGGMNFSTEMFFESVPDEFIDVKNALWRYTPGQGEIPIILPKDYITLYNFGFAQSRSLPKISEGLMNLIRLNIRISGQGKTETFRGRIVGLSTRLNTILVPESFNTYANAEFGMQTFADLAPVRLIVETANPADDAIARYVQAKEYETEDEKLEAGRITYFLKLVVGIVLIIGLVISVLSFYLLMLSIYLLLQKNTSKLETLLLIGYSPQRVALPYQSLTVGLNLTVLVTSILLLFPVRGQYISLLLQLFPQMNVATLTTPIWIGGCIFMSVSLFNCMAIRRKINSIRLRK